MPSIAYDRRSRMVTVDYTTSREVTGIDSIIKFVDWNADRGKGRIGYTQEERLRRHALESKSDEDRAIGELGECVVTDENDPRIQACLQAWNDAG